MTKPFREIALPLLAAGYSPIPIKPGSKRPALIGWQRLCKAPLPLDEIERFRHSTTAYGVGVALGFKGLLGVDIDTEDPEILSEIRALLPLSPVVKRGRKGETAFYYDSTRSICGRKFAGPNGMLVEVLGPGNQAVVPPTLHPDTGRSYFWLSDKTLANTAVEQLPMIIPDVADRLRAVLAPWLNKPRRMTTVKSPVRSCHLSVHEHERHRCYAEATLARELADLAAMIPDTGRNQRVFHLACRLGRWVHHGIIARDRLTSGILRACTTNGLVCDDGRHAVLATIESGLTKSASDTLPDLGACHG